MTPSVSGAPVRSKSARVCPVDGERLRKAASADKEHVPGAHRASGAPGHSRIMGPAVALPPTPNWKLLPAELKLQISSGRVMGVPDGPN